MNRRDVLRATLGAAGLSWAATRTVRGGGQQPAPWANALPAPGDVRVLAEADRGRNTLPMALTPDGRIAAAAVDDSRRTVRTWDAATGRSIAVAEKVLEHPIVMLALAPDGSRVVVEGARDFAMLDRGHSLLGYYSGSVMRVIDAVKGSPVGQPLRIDGSPSRLAIAPGGGPARFLWWDGARRLVAHTWDPATGVVKPPPPVLDEPDPSGGISSWSSTQWIAWSADGSRWAVRLRPPRGEDENSPEQERLRLIDTAAGTDREFEPSDILGREVEVHSLDMSPDGRLVLLEYRRLLPELRPAQISDGHARVALLDFTTSRVVSELKTRKGEFNSGHHLAISPDSRQITVALKFGKDWSASILTVWDVATGRPTHAFRSPPGPVRAVGFLPGTDGRLRVLNGGLGDERAPLVVWDTPPTNP